MDGASKDVRFVYNRRPGGKQMERRASIVVANRALTADSARWWIWRASRDGVSRRRQSAAGLGGFVEAFLTLLLFVFLGVL